MSEHTPDKWDIYMADQLNTWFATTVTPRLLSKRKDYGSANINQTGLYGVAVRMLDKVSRLENLTSDRNNAAINHESVEDTIVDLAGYAAIAAILERGDLW